MNYMIKDYKTTYIYLPERVDKQCMWKCVTVATAGSWNMIWENLCYLLVVWAKDEIGKWNFGTLLWLEEYCCKC